MEVVGSSPTGFALKTLRTLKIGKKIKVVYSDMNCAEVFTFTALRVEKLYILIVLLWN